MYDRASVLPQTKSRDLYYTVRALWYLDSRAILHNYYTLNFGATIYPIFAEI